LFSGHKRAAVGYGSYDPDNSNNIGGMFNRRSGEWRSNSRFNDGWNQYGELFFLLFAFLMLSPIFHELQENCRK
jgi:hypothetical protein